MHYALGHVFPRASKYLEATGHKLGQAGIQVFFNLCCLLWTLFLILYIMSEYWLACTYTYHINSNYMLYFYISFFINSF